MSSIAGGSAGYPVSYKVSTGRCERHAIIYESVDFHTAIRIRSRAAAKSRPSFITTIVAM